MAAIIRCCSSFSHTSGVRPPPHDNSRGSETGKLAKSISYSLDRAQHPTLKIKPLSTNLKERDSIGILQSPFGTVETFDKFSSFEGIRKLKLPVMAVLLTNSLVMGTPLEALAAEICEPESSIFNMPVLLLVALIGATVGGLLARQRKGELQRLNEQLRHINTALRRQAKIESYAPGLSYAPVGARIPAESEIIVDPKKQELISKLKTGKTFLRNQELEKAFAEFKIALELAQSLGDSIEEKKAARGLGASLQRQGKYRDAIQYHNMVLAISYREGEDSGSTEAYRAIADCYTELGDLEQAGKYYDNYIARKKILVLLRDGRKLMGTLRSFDQFANAVLEGACERVIVGEQYCDIPLGLYVIRGENVVLIGEMDTEREELPPHMVRVSETEIKRAQKVEREASELRGTMRKRMEFLDFD